MIKYLLPVFFAAISILPSNAQQSGTKLQPVPIKPTSLTSGKQMYESYCAACHGMTGTGDGSAALALRTAPANLTLLTSKNNGVFPAEHIAAVLRFGVTNPAHGSADMPIWSDLFSTLSPDGRDQANLRIRNLTDYLKTLQKK
jgi:mono/diheme cytochrome c family protein